jgi:hypothetical protein
VSERVRGEVLRQPGAVDGAARSPIQLAGPWVVRVSPGKQEGSPGRPLETGVPWSGPTLRRATDRPLGRPCAYPVSKCALPGGSYRRDRAAQGRAVPQSQARAGRRADPRPEPPGPVEGPPRV